MKQPAEKEPAIYSYLCSRPLRLDLLERDLKERAYSSEVVTRGALRFLDACFDEQFGRDWEYHGTRPVDAVVEREMRSKDLVDVIRLLLSYGLEPNAVYDGRNVMGSLKYIDNEYLAADALALLFEHGGRWDTEVDGTSLFRDIDFDVIFDAANQEDRRKYDALVHCWFVYLGYGAKTSNGSSVVDTFGGFDVERLKNHRNFTFALTHTPNKGERWTLHILERDTFWEVARL